jgi:hydroxymethylbilane synthase
VRTLTIGTRGSPLALVQARDVQARLALAHDRDGTEGFPLRIITTSGDRFQDRPLAEAGGKGLFVRELDQALIDEDIDIAVHSLKDVPTRLAPGMVMAAFLPRADARDGFISSKVARLADLPAGSVIGTASLRRAAQVKALRPDLKTALLRGNVHSRIAKVREGGFDATFLAMAGLARLTLTHEVAEIMDTEVMVPAACQGIVVVTCHGDDATARTMLTRLNDPIAEAMAMAERAALAALDGSCRTAIGAHARLDEHDHNALSMQVEILNPDGQRWSAKAQGALGEAAAFGQALARSVFQEAKGAWLRP